jgi:cytochrome c-type biogenesis protein CcmH
MIRAKRFLVLAMMLGFAIVPLWTVNVTAQSDRARHVSMNLKCLCKGCDMSAGGCSHPGGAFTGPCETAKGMMHEVDQHIAKGETDEQIIQAFVNQYGTIVYIEPPKSGFGLVAWLMPVFYLALGLGLVVFFMRKWRRPAVAGHGASGSQAYTEGGVPFADAQGKKPPLHNSEALQRARAQADRETED